VHDGRVFGVGVSSAVGVAAAGVLGDGAGTAVVVAAPHAVRVRTKVSTAQSRFVFATDLLRPDEEPGGTVPVVAAQLRR
jgi:hypothetical protein